MGTAGVLIGGDVEAIQAVVRTTTRGAEHEPLGRPDGSDLEADLAHFRPDLVVLDVMLPGRDGFTLLDVVRRTCTAGVVMLTARDGVADRLRGFTTGADDYLVEPFVLAELVARVTAVLGRLGCTPSTLQGDDLLLDSDSGVSDSGVVLRVGHMIELAVTEFRLLSYLAAQRGLVYYDASLVEVHVRALRRKLEAHGRRLLHAVRGLGYVLRAGDQ
ncbi:MAG: response regulator transcription factor [Sciscionella sp.]